MKIASFEDTYNKAVEAVWLGIENSEFSSVDEEWSKFSSCIRCCAEMVLGRSMVKCKDMWISDRTLSLATKKKALKNEIMQLSGCLLEQKKLEYTELVKAVRKSCRRDKEVWWSQKAQVV